MSLAPATMGPGTTFHNPSSFVLAVPKISSFNTTRSIDIKNYLLCLIRGQTRKELTRPFHLYDHMLNRSATLVSQQAFHSNELQPSSLKSNNKIPLRTMIHES